MSISDHYHPWVGEQGHAAFVWSVLGGIAASTSTIEVGVGVTCPIVRIHPAVLAQAAFLHEAARPVGGNRSVVEVQDAQVHAVQHQRLEGVT